MNTKITRLLQAGAIGDAMGYLVEFDKTPTIRKEYGINGVSAATMLHRPSWVISDDTQMTMFYMEGLLRQEYDGGYHAFKRWYSTQIHYQSEDISPATGLTDYAALYVRQAPGMTCMSALSTNECFDVQRRANNSKGCGSIMRTMPAILFNNPTRIFTEACLQSARTHGHELGMLTSGWFAVFLAMVSAPEDISSWMETVKKISEQWCIEHGVDHHYHLEMVHRTEQIFTILPNPLLTWDALTDTFGEGWTADSAYSIALYVGMKSCSFEQALSIATNHGGDSDSTASLAAQVYAAIHPDEVDQHALMRAGWQRFDVYQPMMYLNRLLLKEQQ